MTEIPAQLQLPIGEVIRRWRLFRDLTLTQLAAQASLLGQRVTKGYLSGLENGKTLNPAPERVAQLATALGTTYETLYTRTSPPFAEEHPYDDSFTTIADPVHAARDERNLRSLSDQTFHMRGVTDDESQAEDASKVVTDMLNLLRDAKLEPWEYEDLLERLREYLEFLRFRFVHEGQS